MKLAHLAIFALISLSLSGRVEGADYFSPRTASLGGSGHAAPLLNDAIYLNPAFGAFLPSSSLGLGWTSFKGDPEHGRNYNVSIQDGQSELFQAGVGYTQREDGAFVHLGAAKAAIRQLGIGIGGKYALASGALPAFQDATFSIAGVPLEWLTVSIIADNLLEGTKGKSRGFLREYTLGTKFNLMGIMIAYLDPHYTPSRTSTRKHGWNGGLEFVMMKDLFLRGGLFKDSEIPFLNRPGRGFGYGLGWVGPRMSLDYGYMRVLEGHPGLAHVGSHQFGATLYF